MPIFSGPRKKSVRETPGGSGPRARGGISLPLSLQQSLLAFLCCLERVVSAAEAPSVRGVKLGFRRVLPFLPVVGEHTVLRRGLGAALTALIDPFAAKLFRTSRDFDANSCSMPISLDGFPLQNVRIG